jgi:hypothetical protein
MLTSATIPVWDSPQGHTAFVADFVTFVHFVVGSR